MTWFAKIEDLPAFMRIPQAPELLAKGVESMGGRLVVADVIHFLTTGGMQLWAAVDQEVKAVLISEVIDYPRMRTLKLFGLAGSDLLSLTPFLADIKAFAIEMLCQEIEAVDTRAGLQLVVPGFERTGVCLRLKLEAQEAAA